jgi:putative Holliday junction resolvase
VNVTGRILGVDLGERRIGLALSDPTGFLASALRTAEVANPGEALKAVAAAAQEAGAVKVVIGLPRNMDGSLGPAAQKALKFVEDLRARIAAPVDTWDERLTTKSAHAVLIEAGTRREKRKGLVDRIAAQIMLQNYLDARGGG